MNGKSSADTSGRKEREAAQRREAILDAAQQIFESVGYINASMAQIAAKAEFGVGTIYQFFPGKHELFSEVVARGIERYIAGIGEIMGSPAPWSRHLEAYIAYNLTWLEEHLDFHRLIYEIFYSQIPDMAPKMFERFQEIHEQNIRFLREVFIDANRERPRFDPDLMSLMLLGLLHSIGDTWFLGLLSSRPTEYIDRTLQLILREDYRE
jgi:AcrR family transcriptional regulator